MKTCITCGMPLGGEHANDIGMELPEGPVCKFDCENGKLKSSQEIFHGGIEFFASACTNGDKDLAAKLTRKNMKNLAYWQAHPFAELDGEEATDAQMQEAIAKL